MLSSAELKSLEEDFVLFLASQGISADLWQDYLSSDPDQVQDTIGSFSDFVLEKVYSKCRLIEFVTANGWLFYHFNDQSGTIELRGITIEEGNSLDFRQLDPHKAINLIQNSPVGTFRLIKAEKVIESRSSKCIEVHGLLTKGGFISENLETFQLLLDFN